MYMQPCENQVGTENASSPVLDQLSDYNLLFYWIYLCKFWWLLRKILILSYKRVKTNIDKDMTPPSEDITGIDATIQLLRLQQTGSARDYATEFLRLSEKETYLASRFSLGSRMRFKLGFMSLERYLAHGRLWGSKPKSWRKNCTRNESRMDCVSVVAGEVI